MEISVSQDCEDRCWKNYPIYLAYAEAATEVEKAVGATDTFQVAKGGVMRCTGLKRVNIGLEGCERNHHCQAQISAPVIEEVIAVSSDCSVTATIPVQITQPPELARGMNVEPLE